ncbi:hypothetical protein CY34DRAFT_17304 [Suillus luteus UH-Slu-Lm8-n1]|uniref:Unplaced genomic scaffold CY34scaffold_542, whole genome shotgun sequence n=1 Tax=Suillus luteus UH-Slu-Lm8-n1 TaxID=930992 RepID=A0A0C9ZC10_9AGAM|nr:hypothetical protein CY34DRAFT_17304 [Suillus luteus UH-Slu-Lm8-n1]
MKEEESKDKDKKDGEEQNLMLNIKDLHFDNCLPLYEENGKLLVLSKKFFTLKKNKHHEDKASIPYILLTNFCLPFYQIQSAWLYC